jgi:hypothetical protein
MRTVTENAVTVHQMMYDELVAGRKALADRRTYHSEQGHYENWKSYEDAIRVEDEKIHLFERISRNLGIELETK